MRLACKGKAWRSDFPVGVVCTRKELGVPKTLHVQSQRLIQRQGQLVGGIVVLAGGLAALEMQLLDGRAKLLPRALGTS
jgi:hypothetical protein